MKTSGARFRRISLNYSQRVSVAVKYLHTILCGVHDRRLEQSLMERFAADDGESNSVGLPRGVFTGGSIRQPVFRRVSAESVSRTFTIDNSKLPNNRPLKLIFNDI
ncbi:hypothetical protein CA85_23480 [Allorhodopirellula solitaria]|uniref:Uncharacterized protein n=1 Tax=Allorhodopirellula solitaria TaxID=2527987 RepID=A0A5C5XVZ2_9BACT|nr:hypothetical protein CA85_23480 [Allorhodopirellula solitaria]